MKFKLLFIPLFLAVVITSCSPRKGESMSVDSSEEYVIEDEQEIFLDDCLSQKEERYVVFFHSDTCKQCQEIKGDVIAFAYENITKTYFLNIAKPGNKPTICPIDEVRVGADKVEDIAIAGTPTIIEVENGIVIANVPGKDACLTFMNEQRKNANL